MKSVPVLLLVLWMALYPTRSRAQDLNTPPADTVAATPVAPQSPSPASAAAEPEAEAAPAAAPAPQPAPMDPSKRQALTAEFLQLHDKSMKAALLRGRLGLGGPIVLASVAGAVGTWLGIFAIFNATSLKDIEYYIDHEEYAGTTDYDTSDYDGDGVVDRTDLKKTRRAAGVLSVVSAAHLGLSIFAGCWMSKRMQQRQRLDQELRGLDVRRRLLELELGLSADKTTAAMAVTHRF